MSKHFPEQCLVVVADGTQAALFNNRSKTGDLDLEPRERLEPIDLEYDGPSGKTPSEMSGSDLEEATFAKQLTYRLNTMSDEKKFQHVIIAADPVTLGQMRSLMSKQLLAALVGELPKTLTTSSIEDIERSIASD